MDFSVAIVQRGWQKSSMDFRIRLRAAKGKTDRFEEAAYMGLTFHMKPPGLEPFVRSAMLRTITGIWFSFRLAIRPIVRTRMIVMSPHRM